MNSYSTETHSIEDYRTNFEDHGDFCFDLGPSPTIDTLPSRECERRQPHCPQNFVQDYNLAARIANQSQNGTKPGRFIKLKFKVLEAQPETPRIRENSNFQSVKMGE